MHASQHVDQTIAFALRGYDFSRRMWARARDSARAVPLRLLGRPALLVRGTEAVALFYDERSVRRSGAMPSFIQETLFGSDSVHTLDGDEHRHRKANFLAVTYDDAQVARLGPHLEREWQAELDAWVAGGTRSAYDAAVGAIGRAMMRWAGIPGTADAKTRWAHRQAQIVNGFGVPYSPEFLATIANRLWSDRHAKALIEAVRAGTLDAAEGTALHAWAWHRDPNGDLLAAKLAGVELQNSFRPAIAVSRFVAFAAKALHEHPEWATRIRAETAARDRLVGGPLATAFAQEVRRLAPFVPMLPAEAVADLELDGEHLEAGGRLLIDIQATNTDERAWVRPEEFDPERFIGVDDFEALPAFVPQGGGDPAAGHRCPGEQIAVHALAAGIAAMCDPRVTIERRGLDVNRRRMPTKPTSGGIVRSAGAERSGCPIH